jgi:3-keto-L-gulonate-6-phosphate decarboxylase
MTLSEAMKNILGSTEFQEVMKEMKDTQLQMIQYSGDEELQLREYAYQRIRSINEIMSNLESIAQTGEIKDKAWKIL